MAKPKTREVSPSLAELFNRIECDTGVIFVDTPEEGRVITEIFRKYRGHNIYFWSITQGLIEIPKDDDPDRFLPHEYPSRRSRSTSDSRPSRGNVSNTFEIIEEDCRKKISDEAESSSKNIYILRDVDKFFQSPGPLRACRDLMYLVSCSGSSMVFTGYGIQVPSDLEKDSAFVRIDYPTVKEIADGIIPNVQKRIKRHNDAHKAENRITPDFDETSVARACAGLTHEQILNVFGYSTTVKREVDIDLILNEKKNIINKSDILEYWVCDKSLDSVGGFSELKGWFNVQKAILNNPEEAEEFGADMPKGIMLLGVQGSGKATPVNSKVLLTDKTWKRMGDITVGDQVATPNGEKAEVTQIFDHSMKEAVRVEFKDGRYLDCCEDHLWKVYNKNFKSQSNESGWKVIDTKELLRLIQQKDDTRRFYIPLMRDSEYGEKIPIHPYILGILIGDGHLSNGFVSFTTKDEEIANKVKANLISGYKITKHESENKCPHYNIVGDDHISENYYKKHLSLLGLYGKLSNEKFIPDICYRLSLSDKKELLRGLIDSDGSTDNNLSYSTASPSLAAGMQRLVRSIGGQAWIAYRDTCYTYNSEKRQGQSSYRVNIRYYNPRDLVSLPRKIEKLSPNYQHADLKLEIINVERTGIKEDMRCIMLNDEEHLYITDDYIVTHNTFIGKCLAQSWNVGLIKMEMGKIFAGLVGESEKRMRQACAQITAAGGVVLIDEIDKGLSGAGSSDRTDGGTTSRVIGTFLTWMSEPHPGVFVIATANDISALNRNHPELLRKGRFDEIWFSDAPNFNERKEIFDIHLRQRGRDPERVDLEELASIEYQPESGDKLYTYTGAEIEYAIADAIKEKFATGGGKKIEINSKNDISTGDIADKLRIIKPITFISREMISPMRKWSSKHARSVCSEEEKKTRKGKGRAKLNMRGSINTGDVNI